jgi:hypothetical protein
MEPSCLYFTEVAPFHEADRRLGTVGPRSPRILAGIQTEGPSTHSSAQFHGWDTGGPEGHKNDVTNSSHETFCSSKDSRNVRSWLVGLLLTDTQQHHQFQAHCGAVDHPCRAIAQAVCHRLSTAAARVRDRVRSCGISGGQSYARAVVSEYYVFPCQSVIPAIAPQSSSSIIQFCYNRPINCFSNSGLDRPPLWSSGQSSWLQTQRPRAGFPELPDFLSSSGSGTGSTQPLWG